MTIDVVHVLPHARSLGGSERMVLDLLASPQLSDVCQRVAFVSPGPLLSFPESLVLGPGAPARKLGALGCALTISASRPRIVHGWLLRGNLVASLAQMLSPSTRLVTSERNVGHNLTTFKRHLERMVAVRESVATANSGAVAKAAIRRLPRRAAVLRVISPGIEPPRRPPRTVACTAVMVGRLHPVKDHMTALRAWARVRRAHPSGLLVVIGDGPLRQELQGFANSLGLAQAVAWIGEANPLPYLFGAQLFLSTSQAEGFSRALLEALCAGVPCVSTDVGGIAELSRGALRVAPRGDAQAIAQAICDVLVDGDAKARAQQMAPIVCERFSRERCHSSYRALYRELGVA